MHRYRVVLFLSAVLTLGLSACNSPTEPAGVDTLQVLDLVVGAGAEAVGGKTLTVNYTGWLYDRNAPENKGQVFDSSAGKTPFTFVLGTGFVIKGWDQGLVGMRVGGRRRLTIPPHLGYGAQGYGPIPPDSSLVFEVELLSVT